jgi:hypothetical protein
MNKTFTLLLAMCFYTLFAQAQDEVLSKHTPELKKIFKTDKGVFRGYNFGDHRDSIKKSEDGVLDGEGKDFMVYKLALGEGEYAEIMYTFDESNKVTQFGVAFIENINVSVEERMLDDFQSYFTQRYGKFSINAKNDEVWTSADGAYMVEMGDSSEGKGDLLEIEVEMYQKK